eukprot:scaffold23600_cov69-Phaeocystis_antarctica.AAC.1
MCGALRGGAARHVRQRRSGGASQLSTQCASGGRPRAPPIVGGCHDICTAREWRSLAALAPSPSVQGCHRSQGHGSHRASLAGARLSRAPSPLPPPLALPPAPLPLPWPPAPLPPPRLPRRACAESAGSAGTGATAETSGDQACVSLGSCHPSSRRKVSVSSPAKAASASAAELRCIWSSSSSSSPTRLPPIHRHSRRRGAPISSATRTPGSARPCALPRSE